MIAVYCLNGAERAIFNVQFMMVIAQKINAILLSKRAGPTRRFNRMVLPQFPFRMAHRTRLLVQMLYLITRVRQHNLSGLLGLASHFIPLLNHTRHRRVFGIEGVNMIVLLISVQSL